MQHKANSIRPFIGSINFEISRSFYTDLGFQEITLSHNMSYFHTENIGFYLQNAYVKEWIDNTMVFMEVENVEEHYNHLVALNLPSKYSTVRLVPIKSYDWGKECFLHDPSGILWHFGTFAKK